MIFFPSPSISNANFDEKCSILPFICSGQDKFLHLKIASFLDLWVACLQAGQMLGIVNVEDPRGRFFKITFTTFGMTSPALSINTVSPILISLRLISSWL